MDSDQLNLIRIVVIPLKIIFWIWLINLIFSRWTKKDEPEVVTQGEAPPISLPPGLSNTGNPGHYRLLWHGDGPQISFSYAIAQQSTNANNVMLKVKSAWQHTDGRRFLCGEDLEIRDQAAFQLSGIRSSIFVGEDLMSADEFFEKLCAGCFGESEPLTPAPKMVEPPKPVTPPKVPSPPANPPATQTRAYPPGLEFHDTRSERNSYVLASTKHIDWQKVGVLSLSGYHVGKTNGRKEEVRRRILNAVLLEDDLEDIPDRAYALKWGTPGSWKRFRKIRNSLKTFLASAQKKSRRGGDYSCAIHDWKRDIAYLEQLRPYVGKPFWRPKKIDSRWN